MTSLLHAIDHAIELLDDAYPSVDRSIRETLERAQAEITRLLAMTTPQPIETAPRDGTDILLFDGWWRQGRWQEGPQLWTNSHSPTVWLPLPEDPK